MANPNSGRSIDNAYNADQAEETGSSVTRAERDMIWQLFGLPSDDTPAETFTAARRKKSLQAADATS